jgi:hypothetical protein
VKRCDWCQEFFCDSCPYPAKRSIEVINFNESLSKKLAKLIDVKVISDAVVEILAEYAEQEEFTVGKAKAIWDNFLETELYDGIRRCIKYGKQG